MLSPIGTRPSPMGSTSKQNPPIYNPPVCIVVPYEPIVQNIFAIGDVLINKTKSVKNNFTGSNP